MDKISSILGVCLLCIVNLCNGARILAVYPVPCLSHQIFFRTLTIELLKRGHEVVVITTDPAFPEEHAPANLTEIDVHDMSYEKWRKHFWSSPNGQRQKIFSQVYVGFTTMIEVMEDQLRSKQVQELINDKSRKFDLLLLESCIRLPMLFSWIYKVPTILVSSFGTLYGTFELFGAPVHPMLYSSNIRQKTYNSTYWEKISDVQNHYLSDYKHNNLESVENEVLRRYFGPNVPTISELQKNADLFILNMYPEWDLSRPVPKSVVYMGGLHKVPKKEIPKDLKDFLDASVQGVIYLSFGTNLVPSMLPPEKIQIFVKVFSQLPYVILWKWDKDELPGRTPNIKIVKWVPQMEVLRHPNLKLFITQGGLQSTDEALKAGVPVIGIPMVVDQWFNAEKYVHYRLGMALEIGELTEEMVKNAIETVIQDHSYRKNIVKHYSLLSDQPQSPLERAVWWTEHVLRHGGATHLRAPAANMSWTEYLELELVAIVLISLITSFVLLFKVYTPVINFYNNFLHKLNIK